MNQPITAAEGLILAKTLQNNVTPKNIVILANNKNDSNTDDGVRNGNEGTPEKSNGSDSSNHDIPSPALEITIGIATIVTNDTTNDTSSINNNASVSIL